MTLQVLFMRAVKVRRFETLSKQDFIQFVIVGAICGMIWWQVSPGSCCSLRVLPTHQGTARPNGGHVADMLLGWGP